MSSVARLLGHTAKAAETTTWGTFWYGRYTLRLSGTPAGTYN
jgi:hypothetical protein